MIILSSQCTTTGTEKIQLSVVYATSNIKVSIDIFCRIVSGFVFPGKVLANIWFFNLGYISVIKALGMAQDLKLGVYCNVRPIPLMCSP